MRTSTAPATRIAICVDDFGLHRGINEAAMALALNGRITAISCMVGAPAWADGSTQLARMADDRVDLGLHLDFTAHPLAQSSRRALPILIGRCAVHLLDRAALAAEIHAQLDAFEHGVGRRPDHIDGHQHVHQLPVIRELLLSALQERYPRHRPWLRRTRVPAGHTSGFKSWVIESLGGAALTAAAQSRGFRQNSRLLGVYDFQGDGERYLHWLSTWMAAAEEGDLLMCHAGLDAAADDPIAQARRIEYEILSGAAFPEMLARAGVELARLSRLLGA